MTHTYKVGDKGKTCSGDDCEVTGVGRDSMFIWFDDWQTELVYLKNGECVHSEDFLPDTSLTLSAYDLLPPKRGIQG